MAYVARTLSPYDRLLKRGDDMQVMRPAGSTAGPAASISAAPTGSNPQASNASGFVSFDQRLQANQGGAEGMAGKVSDRVKGGAEKATSQLGSLQQQFGKQKEAGSLKPPPAPAPFQQATLSQAAGPAPAQPAQPAPPAGMIKGGSVYDRLLQPGATPTQAAPTLALRQPNAAPLDPDSMQKKLTNRESSQVTYSGPDDLRSMAGFNDVEQSAWDAEDRLAATRDNAGLEGLVTDAYAGPRTSGGSALDAALTGAAGGAHFADLRRQYAGLSKKVADANAAAKTEADAARSATADLAKSYGAVADAEDAQAKTDADRRWQEQVDAETKDIQNASANWLQNSGASAMVQRAWIEAGRPPLGPWLQKNSPELYKQYSTQTQTKSSGGLKGTPQK